MLLRPFLALPGSALEAYAAARELAWIDDESNADTTLKRNFLRHAIAPRLAAAFPGYPATLARAAGHQAEAASLLDDLAAIDARDGVVTGTDITSAIDRDAFVRLATKRAAPCAQRAALVPAAARPARPSAARLDAMQRQLAHSAADSRVRLAHDGIEMGIHRGRIVIHPPAIAPFAASWHGEPSLVLPHGTLEFAATEGTGLAAAMLAERERRDSTARRWRANQRRARPARGKP